MLRTRLGEQRAAAWRAFSPVLVTRAAMRPATTGAEKDVPLHLAMPSKSRCVPAFGGSR